jgi:hypothetical protein
MFVHPIGITRGVLFRRDDAGPVRRGKFMVPVLGLERSRTRFENAYVLGFRRRRLGCMERDVHPWQALEPKARGPRAAGVAARCAAQAGETIAEC